MDALQFSALLERDPGGTWWYVHVPSDVRSALQAHARRGVIAVSATVGRTTWDGSLLPWADGSAQLGVNARIRGRERLELGQEVAVTVRPRVRGDGEAALSRRKRGRASPGR